MQNALRLYRRDARWPYTYRLRIAAGLGMEFSDCSLAPCIVAVT